jgi:hypothetical protein
MADEKHVAKWKLKNLLMEMSKRRNALVACRNKGDATGVERCERALEFNYLRIRKHCAKNDLELPDDVPPEDAA